MILGPAALESRSMPKDFSGKVKTKTKAGENSIAIKVGKCGIIVSLKLYRGIYRPISLNYC